jgi:DNA-binding transcriptional LysR family regulator
VQPPLRPLELRHLRYFVAVAEELHFRRAAERLHMSQPPLSQQIRQLEALVGADLLERTQRRVELTAAGASFYAAARDILDAADRAVRQARRVARGEVGHLAVAFVGSAIYSVVPEILRAFRTAHPAVELTLTELTTAAQVQALAAGRADVGFLRPPVDDPGLEVRTVLREPLVAAVPDGHRLAAEPGVRLDELAGEPLVLLSGRHSPAYRATLGALAGPMIDAPGRDLLHVAEMQTAIGLVAAGVGISIVPASLRGLSRPGVTYVEIDGDPPTIELALAWRSGDTSPVLAAFRACVDGM